MFQKSQINSFKGCQIVGLDTLVKVDLLGGKSNPQQGRVTKLTLNSRVMIFKNGKGYFNMVNRRLQKQHEGSSVLSLLESSASGGVWEPGPRAWGERIPNSPFIVHKVAIPSTCWMEWKFPRQRFKVYPPNQRENKEGWWIRLSFEPTPLNPSSKLENRR
jgi:hypothetical protein